MRLVARAGAQKTGRMQAFPHARKKMINKTVRLDEKKAALLTQEAASRGMSLSQLVRVACDQLIERDGLATELVEMEDRIAATMERLRAEQYATKDDVQLLIALLDQTVKFLFFTTPEVIDREAAGVVGNKRYDNFINELHKSFGRNRKRASLSTAMEDSDEISESNITQR